MRTEFVGAERGTRTPTSRLSPADFKSAASASSAIPAKQYQYLSICLLTLAATAISIERKLRKQNFQAFHITNCNPERQKIA